VSIQVVFIGGYQSNALDVDLWKTSAENQRSDVRFDVYPYPSGAGSLKPSAEQGFDDQYAGVVKLIADVNADTLYIVGHSSGCAIANKLNSLIPGNHKNITVVDLDGFSASADQAKGSKVQVWSAVGPGGKGRSVNWAGFHKIYIATRATNAWALHFSLVNSAATNVIDWDSYPAKGYTGCMANLCWLPPKA
jgi:hypothetical protein